MKKLLVSALLLAIPALAQPLEVIHEGTDTRTVTHAFGETEIPAAPQRIVVTFPEFAEYLGALGVDVSGVSTCGAYLELPFFAPLVADAARVGACGEPNLEVFGGAGR